MAKHFVHAHGLRHRRGMLRNLFRQVSHCSQTAAFHTTLPQQSATPDADTVARTLRNDYRPHRPRIVTVFAAQIAALQKRARRLPGPSTQEKGIILLTKRICCSWLITRGWRSRIRVLRRLLRLARWCWCVNLRRDIFQIRQTHHITGNANQIVTADIAVNSRIPALKAPRQSCTSAWDYV